MDLSEEQIGKFWHRSFTSVDGLWFVKVEEKYGFDAALDIDNEVWKVLPKIQSRMIKSMTGAEQGLDGLLECLSRKLDQDGFTFKIEKDAGGHGFRVVISRCPWHDILVNSGREEYSGRIGTLICTTENSVWASEFGDDISFELGDRICKRSESCILRFSSAAQEGT